MTTGNLIAGERYGEFEGHTPGPWHVDTDYPGWVAADNEPRDGGDIICDAPQEGEASITRWRANAALIAAAPSLLSDHKRMSAEIERLRGALEKTLGHLLNAQIDIETGTKKETTLATIKGGVLIARAALASSSADGSPVENHSR